MVYGQLAAYAACFGGGATRGKVYNKVTIAYAPDAISTGHCYHPFVFGWKTINYTELYDPPPNSDIYTRSDCFLGSSFGRPDGTDLIASPVVSLPRELSLFDPAWKSCGPFAYGAWDPPYVLTKEAFLGAGPGAAANTATVASQQITPNAPISPTAAAPGAHAINSLVSQTAMDPGNPTLIIAPSKAFSAYPSRTRRAKPSSADQQRIASLPSQRSSPAQEPKPVQLPPLIQGDNSVHPQDPLPSPTTQHVQRPPPEESVSSAQSNGSPPLSAIKPVRTVLSLAVISTFYTTALDNQVQTIPIYSMIDISLASRSKSGPLTHGLGWIIMNGFSPTKPSDQTQSTKLPASYQAIATLGTYTILADPSGIQVDGTTLTKSGPTLILSNSPLYVNSAGFLVAGTSLINVPPQFTHLLLPTPVPSQVLATVAGHTIVANPSAVLVDGTTLVKGGPIITLNNTPFYINSAGSFIAGTSTIDISLTIPVTQVLDPASPTVIALDNGVTVTNGGATITVDGTTIYYGSSWLVIGTRTIALPTGSGAVTVRTIGVAGAEIRVGEGEEEGKKGNVLSTTTVATITTTTTAIESFRGSATRERDFLLTNWRISIPAIWRGLWICASIMVTII